MASQRQGDPRDTVCDDHKFWLGIHRSLDSDCRQWINQIEQIQHSECSERNQVDSEYRMRGSDMVDYDVGRRRRLSWNWNCLDTDATQSASTGT